MTDRANAVALYRFLAEFTQLRTKVIRDIASYEQQDGQVIWSADVPHEPDCDCIAWRHDPGGTPGGDLSAESWLEIRRPRLRRHPEPPESVRAWVRRDQLQDSELDYPELPPTLPGQPDQTPALRLDDHPEVQAAWRAYVENHWQPWAEQDRRQQAVQKIYTDLFSMFQRQQRLGERYEVIFGLGFLSWSIPGGYTVGRHLVAAHVTVEFEPDNGMLTVTPAGEGARPSLEQDMLDPADRPALASIERALEEIGDSLWEADAVDSLLKRWVNSASAKGQYVATLNRPQRPGPDPVVHLAPALILRRRAERSYISAFEYIVDQLEDGAPVPECVSQFVDDPDDHIPAGMTGDNDGSTRPGEIYFPLPANDEQRQIVERLATNQGVVVQGPPGTGKSHTIVNLICHALACGQRILVTSHAARALKVLQRMIQENAPDLAPLCVVLLGDNPEALRGMERSVQGIASRWNGWNKVENEAGIECLEGELDRARRSEAKVLRDLREVRERETRVHETKFGYRGTLAHIADTLRDERKTLSWIPGDTPERLDPPLAAAEFKELVSLLGDQAVGDWESGGWKPLDLGILPASDEFERSVRIEDEARAAYRAVDAIRQRREYELVQGMAERDRHDFVKGLQDLMIRVDRIESHPLPWTGTATKQILGGFERTWQQLHDATLRTAKTMEPSATWLDDNQITPSEIRPNLTTLHADASDLLDHLEAGHGWGLGPFRATAVKRSSYIRDLRIGGRPCRTKETVGDLVRRVAAEREVELLRERWTSCNGGFNATTFTALTTELRDLCSPIEEAFAASRMKVELAAILQRTPGAPLPDWADSASLSRLRQTLIAVDKTHRYEAARGRIDDLLKPLLANHSARVDPVSNVIREAITARDAHKYALARQRAAENAALAERLSRKRELLDRLTDAAPELGRELRQTFANSSWAERADQFERAWNWSRALAWVARLIEPGSEDQLRVELDQRKQAIAIALEQIAAEKAWKHCFNRMSQKQLQSLVAWQKEVKAIGKGTGKFAPQHRRIARKYLDECRSAIPALVMPLHRVAETIAPDSESFDIAIIDEASQSGPEAMLLAFLARRLVVVGDDKQIQPNYAGVDFGAVNQLRQSYIPHLPFAHAYGVDHSFFDLAQIKYPGRRIRLREHFRCMPEIIQFSNDLSYSDEPLIPLRQYGAGRLEPPITTCAVPDGYQKGAGPRLVNPPEAEAVVGEIVRVCEDPAYTDKTIGVISLVGSAQAREIETQLIHRLGPQEMEHRQLVCGDAYAFQGDERDVMFLSMVSSPSDGGRIRALTDGPAQRRFNVAASRAKDQLVLYHTATLADLSPGCMRHRLLKYCLAPNAATSDTGIDLSRLEQLAHKADRQRVSPPPPFESWFELDVFLRITRRKYRVIPQYAVHGYRIDHVVEGMDRRLAVECDGDRWHGADRYDADAARQRDLERCGWTFWRVRESAFRLDPDEALEGLWEALDRNGIRPVTDEDADGTRHGDRVRRPYAGRRGHPPSPFVVGDSPGSQGRERPIRACAPSRRTVRGGEGQPTHHDAASEDEIVDRRRTKVVEHQTQQDVPGHGESAERHEPMGGGSAQTERLQMSRIDTPSNLTLQGIDVGASRSLPFGDTPEDEDRELRAELTRLRAENAKLRTLASNPNPLTLKVSQKGAVSVYGLGNFPVTLYKEQWEGLLDMANDIRVFIEENAEKLKTRGVDGRQSRRGDTFGADP